jgi:PAS domain S-box-containing protein
MKVALKPYHLTSLVQITALCSVYLITTHYNSHAANTNSATAHQILSIVWPPTGIALAVLLLAGYRVVPFVWLGMFLIDLWAGIPALLSLTLSAGSTLESLAAAFILSRWPGFDSSFKKMRDVGAFVVAVLVSNILVVSVCTFLFSFGGLISNSHQGTFWSGWVLGDITSALTLAPLVLIWAKRPPSRSLSRMQILKAVALGIFLIAINAYVFGGSADSIAVADGHHFARQLLATINLLLLFFATYYFEQRGESLAIFLLSAIGVLGTELTSKGLFLEDMGQRSMLLQIWLSVNAGVFLALGAYVFERRRAIGERETELVRVQIAHADVLKRSVAAEAMIVAQKEHEKELAAAAARAVKESEERATLAAQALTESEERYRSVVELSPDAIVVCRNNEIEFVNSTGLELFGAQKLEDLLGRSLYDLTHVDYHPIVRQRLQSVMAGKSGLPIEKKIVRLDGTIRDVEAAVSAYSDRKGHGLQIVLRDTTDRKQTEKALRESEDRFRRIYESNMLGIAFTTMDGRFLDANQAFCDLIGYTREDIRAGIVRWNDLMAPQFYQTTTTCMDELRANGICATRETACIHKNGRQVPILIGATVFSALKPQIVFFAINVTKLKLREEEQRGIAEKFQAAFEFAHDAILSADSAGNVIYYNRQAQKAFGYSANELAGKPLASLIAGRSRDEFRRIASKDATQPQLTEIMGLRNDGIEFPVEMSLSRWKTAEGPFLTVNLRDITDRKRTEEERANTMSAERARRAEAEDAKRRATFLAEASSTLASSLDFTTTLASVARLAVPHFADMCNVYTVENHNSIRRLATEHSDPNKLKTELELDRSYPISLRDPHGPGLVLRTGKLEWRAQVSDSLLIEMAREDEHLQLLRNSSLKSYICTPMIARGHVLGAIMFGITESNRPYSRDDVALAEDLAHRAAIAIDNASLFREAQQALFTAEKAVSSREELMAIVSHDLKNPLHAISLGTAAAQKSVEAIRHSVDRMNRLIGDLLDIASIDAANLSIKKQPTPAPQLIEQIREMFESAASAKSVRLNYELAPELPLLDVDGSRIVQVLSNLIGNAIKFTPTGGEVTLHVEFRREDVCFVVSDSGPGIPEEQFDHIFDRHWQAKETAHLGIGLGLAIAKGIVESHGGQIWVKSQIGRGSSFFFTVPAVKSPMHYELQTQH